MLMRLLLCVLCLFGPAATVHAADLPPAVADAAPWTGPVAADDIVLPAATAAGCTASGACRIDLPPAVPEPPTLVLLVVLLLVVGAGRFAAPRTREFR